MLDLLVLAIAPALFVLAYIYLKDRYEPEPLGWVVKVFFIGGLMVIPAALIEAPFPEGLFVAVVIAPVVEESLKFAAVYFTVYRDEEFDEPMDGIVYAVAAALGFAMIENIFYVLEGGLSVGILRAITSVPAHAFFSSIWGYTLGLARFRPERERPLLIASGLAAAIVFHGVFNLLALDSELLGLVVILVLLVPFGWWMIHRNIAIAEDQPQSARWRLAKGAEQADTMIREQPLETAPDLKKQTPAPPGQRQQKFCTECGSQVGLGAKFCRHCGALLDYE
jgi:RsiW-degrading membrane proteinase PrsW (M82 family)